LPTYTHPHVLVIDEVGDLGYGPDGANVLFQVVNDRHVHSPAHDRSVVDLSDRSRLISRNLRRRSDFSRPWRLPVRRWRYRVAG
jgi:MoxR-like ATPase